MKGPKLIISVNALKNNRGTEALLRGLITIIKKKYSDASIYVVSSEYSILQCDRIEGVERYLCRFRFRKKISLIRFLARLFEKIFGENVVSRYLKYGHLKVLVEQSDYVIVVGADNYDKSYGMFEMLHQFNLYLRDNTKGKLWLYDCSIEYKHIDSDVISDMKLFDLITVREKVSYESLIKSRIEIPVYCIPDPAFIMQAEPCKEGEEIAGKKIVGINVSKLIASPKYGSTEEKVLSNYCEVVKYIRCEIGYEVILIPHVMNNEDLYMLRKIKSEFAEDEFVRLIDNERLTAPQLKYIIAQLDFLVTARTHASIAAYSLGIPTMVLGYSIKSRGIAEELFDTVENYVFPVQKLEDSEDLLKAFKFMFEKKDEISTCLYLVIEEYVNRIWKLMDYFD